MTKEQIEAALDTIEEFDHLDSYLKYCNKGKPTPHFVEFLVHKLNPNLETIQFALKLTMRLMDEPSEGMIKAARSREDTQELYPDIFKAMRDQLIQEVLNDRT